MDYDKIIAEKDSEIAALKKEIEILRGSIESTNLEEMQFDDNLVTEDSNLTLKVPDDEEVEEPNVKMPNLMELMSMLMQNSGMDFGENTVGHEDEEKEEEEEPADSQEDEVEEEDEEEDEEEEEEDEEEEESVVL